MSKEWINIAEAVANEKGMPLDRVLNGLEFSLATLLRKQRKGGQYTVKIDRKTGEPKVQRRYSVVDMVSDPLTEISTVKLEDLDVQITPGQEIIVFDEDMPRLDRMGANTFRQVIIQHLRQGLRETIVEEWQSRIGELVFGQIKRIDKNRIYVDLGEPAEGVLDKRDLISGETFKAGQRIRAVVDSVATEDKGPAIRLSRTNTKFLEELLKREVPEIEAHLIQIRGLAREAGQRSKVAISASARLKGDPIHTFVGMRGSRMNTLSNELNGEKIDVIMWDANPSAYILNALHPAEVERLFLDEEKKVALVGVAEDRLARAIGRKGQNVKLASQLTGWELKVQTSNSIEATLEQEKIQLCALFATALDVDQEIAQILVDNGFTSVEEIAYVPVQELLDIDGFDEQLVDELRSRAQDALLVQALGSSQPSPTHALLALPELTQGHLDALLDRDLDTLEKMSDLSVDELVEDYQMDVDRRTAAQWILKAREILA